MKSKKSCGFRIDLRNCNWALHRISWKLTFRKFTICVIFRIKFNFLFSLSGVVCIFHSSCNIPLWSRIRSNKKKKCVDSNQKGHLFEYRQMRHENYCEGTNCNSYKFCIPSYSAKNIQGMITLILLSLFW